MHLVGFIVGMRGFCFTRQGCNIIIYKELQHYFTLFLDCGEEGTTQKSAAVHLLRQHV
jgi:hypothetical protein